MTASVELHGVCHERFQPIRDALAANFENGREIGASVAVIWRGETVVDLWGGSADRAQTRPWERDTIVQVFSISKIMLVLCMMMLVDRDQLDLDAPVARLASAEVPIPYAKHMEFAAIPQVDDIVAAALDLVGGR